MPTLSDASTRRYSRRELAAWCLYDFGNSVFPAVVLSFVFAPYFTEQVAANREQGSALWGYATAASAFGIAIVSPFAGAFCDKGGRRKLWLAGFSLLAVIATGLLWYVEPAGSAVFAALALVAVANLGFELAYVFYNAMLPTIVPRRMIGRASGWGWSVGYFGSLASMGAVWLLFFDGGWLAGWLDRDAYEHVRAAALFGALWFVLFASVLFVVIPDTPASGRAARAVVREGLSEVAASLRHLRRLPSIAWYLAAHMVYIDGLNTLFVFGPIYAAGTLGMNESQVLQFGIGIYVTAGVGSLAFSWLDDRIGGKRVLLLSLAAMVGLGSAALLVDEPKSFMGLALGLGLFMGPVQAASRSLMARLAPEHLRNQMFGLYALAGRATAPLGPFLVGLVIALSASQRAGMALFVVFLALGALLLLPVREPRGDAGAGATAP